METLEKAFWDYFIYLPQHISKWNKSIELVIPNLKAFKNQSEQYLLVKSKKWNDEILLKKFPDIEIKLFEKLLNGIEQEMLEIRKFQNVLATLNKELFRKYEPISKYTKLDAIDEFTSKGTVVPPTYCLIEFSENSKNYFAALYFQFDIALCSLKYEDQSTVAELERSINKLTKLSDEIKDILAITTFCAE